MEWRRVADLDGGGMHHVEVDRFCFCRWVEKAVDLEGDGVSDTGIGR